jgi:hypothetical protein
MIAVANGIQYCGDAMINHRLTHYQARREKPENGVDVVPSAVERVPYPVANTQARAAGLEEQLLEH